MASGSNIPTQDEDEIVVQSSQPSNPYEGLLWRDTSAGTLKQYDGSSWVTVGNSVDGTSIVDGTNGLEVRKPSRVVFGDFENGMGSWNTTVNTSDIFTDYVVGRFDPTAKNITPLAKYNGSYVAGAYFLNQDENGSGSGSVDRSIDVSNVPEVLIPYRIYGSGNNEADTMAEIVVNGNTKEKVTSSGNAASSEGELVIDTSSISTLSIKAYAEINSNFNNNSECYAQIDWVRRDRSEKTVDKGSGGIA